MIQSAENNPFIGLRAYETYESILFFGRNDQTLDLLQKLHLFRFLAVIGSSGSGKSSLVKAGLIPRLKAGYLVNEQSNWIIASMKPGNDALLNFTEAILGQLTEDKDQVNAHDLKEKIAEQGVDAILAIISLLKKDKTNFLLLVDQFEELFRFILNKKEIERKDESASFVNILLDLSRQKDVNFYVTITMRSDFIGDCSQFYGLPEAINKGLYLVPRLTRSQLEIIVEAPVRLYNRQISPALTTKLLNDAQMIQDMLPLLQHVLMRTWNYEMNVDKNGELDLEDYKNVGGIENALSIHADEALQGMSDKELSLTKKIFQALTAVDQNGRKIRRPAYLSNLEIITGQSREAVLNIINRFIAGNRSFLITSRVEDKDDLLIDISHESLIRQWGLLNEWVNTEADSAKIFLRLLESEKLYKEGNKNLLGGNELNQFWQWYFSFNPGPAWAKRYSESFDDCIDYLKQSEAAEKKQKAIKLRNRRLLIGAVALVFVVISLFSIKIYRDFITSGNQLAQNYWANSQASAGKNNLLDALHLIAVAERLSSHDHFIKNLLINGESFLPVAVLKNMFPDSSVINAATFSPDGKWIVMAGFDGSVIIIDKTTGKQVGVTMHHDLPVNSAVFSADQKFVLTAGNDKTARIWDIETGKLVNDFQHRAAVVDASFSPDEKFVVTACVDMSAYIWDIATGRQIESFKHNAAVVNAVFSSDQKMILTSGNDSTARLWDIATGKQIHSFKHNGYNVKSAVFSADKKWILTSGNDSTARIWNVETGEQTGSLRHTSEVTDGIFSPDGKWLITSTLDRYVHIWSFTTHKQIGPALKHGGPVYSVDLSKDGKWLLTAGEDKTARLWNIAAPVINTINSFKTNANIVSDAVFNGDGKQVLTCGFDGIARIWDITNGKLIESFDHGSVINKAVFSKDGKWILTCGRDSMAKLWDINTGKQQYFFKHTGIVNSAVFSADGKTILTTGDDSTGRLWTTDAKQVKSFPFEDKVRNGVFSPDQKTILITGSANIAYLLDAGTGKELNSFKQDDVIKTAVFSSDGKWVLTAGWDKTARLWNAFTGKQDGPSMQHDWFLSGAVFSPGGKWILTSGWDSTVRIWDIATKKQITSLILDAPVNSAVFSPDEKTIAIASRDSNAYLLNIPGDLDIPVSLFKLQAQVITGVRYNTETNETECISSAQWRLLNEQYQDEAKQHYKTCRYLQYNLWRRFNSEVPGETNASLK